MLCAERGIKPNTVSLAGMAFGLLAGVAYYHYRDSAAAIAAFLLMIAWHVMDGADGQLARLTNAQSEFGKVLDGICDYVTFIAVYTALGLAMIPRDGAAVILTVVLAGVCHAVQAAAYESQRQDYIFWGWGRGAGPAAIRPGAAAKKAPAVTAGMLRVYERVQNAVGSNSAFSQMFFAILAAHPAAAEDIRAQYRARFAPAIRQWSILSANYRTLGIFICAFLRVPLLYFVFEIIGFSLILLLLARQQSNRTDGFLAGITRVFPAS